MKKGGAIAVRFGLALAAMAGLGACGEEPPDYSGAQAERRAEQRKRIEEDRRVHPRASHEPGDEPINNGLQVGPAQETEKPR